ncbi:hypothetical protein KA005_70475, partial [bacterium]|nr:hypothetical protein [bacterium]
MSKLLVIGYRGYGDWLFAIPALSILFDQYDEGHLECNERGFELFKDDSRITTFTVFDISYVEAASVSDRDFNASKVMNKRWDNIKKEIKPDKIVNLFQTLESRVIAEPWQPVFYEDSKSRQKTFKESNWYYPTFDKCGIPIPEKIDLEGLRFLEPQIEMVERWKKKHDGQFVVFAAVSGSGF